MSKIIFSIYVFSGNEKFYQNVRAIIKFPRPIFMVGYSLCFGFKKRNLRSTLFNKYTVKQIS